MRLLQSHVNLMVHEKFKRDIVDSIKVFVGTLIPDSVLTDVDSHKKFTFRKLESGPFFAKTFVLGEAKVYNTKLLRSLDYGYAFRDIMFIPTTLPMKSRFYCSAN